MVAVAALPVVLLLKVPLTRVPGTSVIGIVILALPSKLCAVPVMPLTPIVLAVASFVAVPAFPVVSVHLYGSVSIKIKQVFILF